MNVAMKKHLSTSDLHATSLDSNNSEKYESKEYNSSEFSANEEQIESDVNSAEDAPKHTKQSKKKRTT